MGKCLCTPWSREQVAGSRRKVELFRLVIMHEKTWSLAKAPRVLTE